MSCPLSQHHGTTDLRQQIFGPLIRDPLAGPQKPAFQVHLCRRELNDAREVAEKALAELVQAPRAGPWPVADRRSPLPSALLLPAPQRLLLFTADPVPCRRRKRVAGAAIAPPLLLPEAPDDKLEGAVMHLLAKAWPTNNT